MRGKNQSLQTGNHGIALLLSQLTCASVSYCLCMEQVAFTWCSSVCSPVFIGIAQPQRGVSCGAREGEGARRRR